MAMGGGGIGGGYGLVGVGRQRTVMDQHLFLLGKIDCQELSP